MLGNQVDDLVAVRGGIEQVAAHLGGLRVIEMGIGCKVAHGFRPLSVILIDGRL